MVSNVISQECIDRVLVWEREQGEHVAKVLQGNHGCITKLLHCPDNKLVTINGDGQHVTV
jgi:hypothetical protein